MFLWLFSLSLSISFLSLSVQLASHAYLFLWFVNALRPSFMPPLLSQSTLLGTIPCEKCVHTRPLTEQVNQMYMGLVPGESAAKNQSRWKPWEEEAQSWIILWWRGCSSIWCRIFKLNNFLNIILHWHVNNSRLFNRTRVLMHSQLTFIFVFTKLILERFLQVKF